MPDIPGIIAAAEDIVAPPGGSVLTLTLAAAPYTNNASQSSTVHPSITPPADTDIYVLFGWRAGALRTNSVPVAGFATTGAFTEVANASVDGGDGTTNAIRAAIYKATTTGTPGSGTTTCDTSGSTFQQIIALYYIDNATGNLQVIETNWTGATESASWDGTPSGHRASIGLIVQNGVAGSLAFDDELVNEAGFPLVVGQAAFAVGKRLGTISDPQDISGAHSGRNKAFVAASVTGASS